MSKSETPVTVPQIRSRKGKTKISCLTAYDFPTARLLDESGIDLLLVGDSLGMVIQGHPNTLPVSMEEMLYHTRLVARAARRALVVADMPFGSYQSGKEEAIRNAVRFLKEGAAAVKLEGGEPVRETVKALVSCGIPVMGHVGLTPQSIHAMGGYRVQKDSDRILKDARALEAAGAFSIVLEGIPAGTARELTESLSIPTIGIGAGPHCDGQVLVFHDLVGLSSFAPKFVKRYADLAEAIRKAALSYKNDVEAGRFPAQEQSYA
jgi:3-methyl-2-oxobutanoate hydroxymethyltransferase